MSSGVQKAKIEVPLARDQRADAAAAAVLRRLLAVISENVDGAIDGSDIEYLHQLRVAVRRSRTVQRQLRGVFPALELPGFRSDFRWLQRATGEARDLDVHVDDFGDLAGLLPEPIRGDLEPMRAVLVEHRAAARSGVEQTLRSRRMQELVQDWDRLLESLVELPLDDRPDAQKTIAHVAGRRIRKVYRRIVAMGEQITESSPASDYHELRKKGKELRYLLELFGVPLFAPASVDPLLGTLKDVQDLLGRHQDREVQAAKVKSLAPEVASRPGGGAACLAMGTLVERLRSDELAARREFAERFAKLSAEHERRAVSEAF